MKGHDWINTCLPDELIMEIFRRIEAKPNRDACSLVCKRWFHLERIGRCTLRIGASGCPDQIIEPLGRRFPNVAAVHVDERLSVAVPLLLCRRQAGVQCARSSCKLRYMNDKSGCGSSDLESYCLTDAGLAALGEGFAKLEKLSLIWCSSVTSVGLKSIAERCRTLKSLDLQTHTNGFEQYSSGEWLYDAIEWSMNVLSAQWPFMGGTYFETNFELLAA